MNVRDRAWRLIRRLDWLPLVTGTVALVLGLHDEPIALATWVAGVIYGMAYVGFGMINGFKKDVHRIGEAMYATGKEDERDSVTTWLDAVRAAIPEHRVRGETTRDSLTKLIDAIERGEHRG